MGNRSWAFQLIEFLFHLNSRSNASNLLNESDAYGSLDFYSFISILSHLSRPFLSFPSTLHGVNLGETSPRWLERKELKESDDDLIDATIGCPFGVINSVSFMMESSWPIQMKGLRSDGRHHLATHWRWNDKRYDGKDEKNASYVAQIIRSIIFSKIGLYIAFRIYRQV